MENEITTLLLSGPDDDPPVPKLTNGLPVPDPDEEEHSALQNPLGMLATAAIDQSVENTVRGPAKYWNSAFGLEWVPFEPTLINQVYTKSRPRRTSIKTPWPWVC